MKPKFKKYLFKFFKISGSAILIFIIALIVGTLILHLPSIQSSIAEKVLAEIEKKVDTDIRIKGIAVTLPGKIMINELYASDNKGDTLIYSDKTSVSFTLLKILNSEI